MDPQSKTASSSFPPIKIYFNPNIIRQMKFFNQKSHKEDWRSSHNP